MPGDTSSGDNWFANMPSATDLMGDWGRQIYGEVTDNGVLGGKNPDGFAEGDTLGQSQYDFRYTVFPSTVGMDNLGHYMVININVPTEGQKLDGLALGKAAGAFTGSDFITPLRQVSKLDVLRFGNYESYGGLKGSPLSIPRNTRRIAESIALHMPTPLVWNDLNVYEEVSLTALAGRVGIGTVTGTAAFLQNVSRLTRPLGKALEAGASIVAGVADTVAVASSIMQNPINPAVEVVFANKMQRQFAFELLMAPRNEKESIAIKKIVKTLRFHGSPELNPRTLGFTWIPPAEFEITFFNKGNENTNIMRVNTCVLERCEVDYAPSGTYSTFRNGHPVSIRLSLAFRELEPVHKLRVLQGF